MRPARLPLLAAAAVVAAAGLTVGVREAQAGPPVTVASAGLQARLHEMPADQVVPFLAARGVRALPPVTPGTAVVARVSWRAVEGPPETYYTLLLAGGPGRPGVVEAVYGPDPQAVALGNGSLWDDAVEEHPWLAGNGSTPVDGGFVQWSQNASVPAGWDEPVWVVGRVVHASDDLEVAPATVADPDPVLGVGLSTSDRVWWVQRVAG